MGADKQDWSDGQPHRPRQVGSSQLLTEQPMPIYRNTSTGPLMAKQGENPEAVLGESAKYDKTAGTPYADFLRW